MHLLHAPTVEKPYLLLTEGEALVNKGWILDSAKIDVG